MIRYLLVNVKAPNFYTLTDSQEQYQMAFIKCQYTDDYLLTKNQLVISRKRDYIKDNRNEKCYMCKFRLI